MCLRRAARPKHVKHDLLGENQLPMASRKVKPLDCQTNSSSYGKRGQEEQGKVKELYSHVITLFM